MKKLKTILCLALCAFMLAGCAAPGPDSKTGVRSLTAGVKPCAGEAAWEDFSPALDFSLKLLAQGAAEGDENLVLSPLSAYICLGMVMNGAAGDTLKEFEAVMGLGKAEVNRLVRTITPRLTGERGSTELSAANSLWMDDDSVRVEESFIQAIADNYDGELFTADLPSMETLKAINKWVNDKTRGLIPTLHDKPYAEDTVLVLLNALYMKAKWQRPFEGYATGEMPFIKADGAEVNVPFMRMFGETQSYIQTGDARGVILPYDDGRLSFAVLMPDGDLREYAAGLTGAGFAGILDSAEDRLVNLSMPKFSSETSYYLTEALKAMGLESAFDPYAADLAPMGEGADGPLYISYVFQKVKIDVDEEGTEAAAVTEVADAEDCALEEEEPVELTLDRPFLYAVVDMDSGLPLFMGFMENPQ